MTCQIPNCHRPVKVKVRNLCGKHYAARRRSGTLDDLVDQQFDPISFCRCPDPQPEVVKLWGHVTIDATQCATCSRGIR